VKALFFSPFANIWEHSFPEALVAEGLQEQGYEIVTVRCNHLFQSFCVAMSAAGLTADSTAEQKERVCRACVRRQKLIDKDFGFQSLVLESYLNVDDYREAQLLSSQVNRKTWTDLELHGVPIGRYAAYEFLLNYKVVGTDISDALFPLFRNQLCNSILVLIASGRILDEIRPDTVLTYNRLYGVNHAFLAVAEQKGIPTYSLQGGGHITFRGETMTLFRESQTQLQVLESDAWHRYETMPIGDSEVSLVASHFDGLLEASSAFAYSSAFKASDPQDLRTRLNVPDGAPVVLIPMSSEDELNAAQLADLLPDTSSRANLFADQFAWIRHIFTYARKRPDVCFILRLHPRMFPNKRENVTAPIVEKVMELITEAPSNVVINNPTDDISLYDLMQILDVVLGYRSSVGGEMAAFGIPVVAPANKDFFTYPDSLQKTAYSVAEFDSLIDQAVLEGWSIENMRNAYRWYAFLFSRIAVDFSESVNAKPISIRPKKPGLRLWLWRKAVFILITVGPLIRERLALRNRSTSQLSKAVIHDVVANKLPSLAVSNAWPTRSASLEQETELLRNHLSKLCSGIWKDISAPGSLAERVRSSLS
jgi:hypothetical protein